MIPFRLTITTFTPPLLARETYLDGLLAWCRVQEAGGDFSAGDDLPLAKHASGVWHASTWFVQEDDPIGLVWPDAEFIVKKALGSDIRKFEAYLDKPAAASDLKSGAGPYKAYNVKLRCVPHHRFVFYGVGDTDRTLDLLRGHLLHLGAKSSLGKGRVESIEIETMQEDRSLVIHGEAVRPIPAGSEVPGLRPDAPLGLCRTKSPYWLRTGLVPCRLPTTSLREPQARG